MSGDTISHNNQKSKSVTAYQILKDLFNHYNDRESQLIQLAYSLGANQKQIADALGVDPAIISRKFSKKGAIK